MLDLESAIKHCEEVAYQNKILMKRYDDASGYNRSHNEKSEQLVQKVVNRLYLYTHRLQTG